MPRVDVVRETDVSTSIRARQLEGMFDVPPAKKCRVEWHGNVPYDELPWNVGLIVGPSGSGKSTIARELFGERVDWPLKWKGKSVVDDFATNMSMEQIATVCQAVGFNTIPAWLRPYAVLSTGEKFRVELARRLLECDDPIVVDEFTSVVDRQVAKIGCHAVQKYVRKNNRQFVAVTCHHDVVDWLQPDWVLDPAGMGLVRRSVQPRPKLDVTISMVHHSAWSLFAPFHYMSASLHRRATCFCAFVEGQPAAFGGVLGRPHPRHGGHIRIMGLSRLVTLPDWQGLGLAFILCDTLAAAYRALGYHFHTYPAHPALIRSFDRSPRWGMVRRPAAFRPPGRRASFTKGSDRALDRSNRQMRPCATFRWIGNLLRLADARRLTGTTNLQGSVP